MVESLPMMCESLGSIPSIVNKTKSKITRMENGKGVGQLERGTDHLWGSVGTTPYLDCGHTTLSKLTERE